MAEPGIIREPDTDEVSISHAALRRRVERAREGTEDGQPAGLDRRAFVAFNELKDELDEAFLDGVDESVLSLPDKGQTPADALPRVPDERLLLLLLRYVRLWQPSPLHVMMTLTRMAIKAHLQPFMALINDPLTGRAAYLFSATLPAGYKLNLQGQPPEVPWPAAGWHRRGGASLLLVKAATAAKICVGDLLDCGYWIAERALQEMESEDVCAAARAELFAAGVLDTAAALDDLRFSCHKDCCCLLASPVGHRFRPQAAGQAQEWEAAFRRHADAMLSLRPDLPVGFVEAAYSWFEADEFLRAQVVALKGLAAADAARDGWFGVCLRQVLAGSIAMAGEARTPGKLRVGVLRQLLGELAALEKEYKTWVPKGFRPPCERAGQLARSFFESHSQNGMEICSMPNQAVVRCLGGLNRLMASTPSRARLPPTCDGCGESIDGRPKLCGQCRAAWYHGAACQRRHWRQGGHKAVCQPLSDGRLDWAAELAAAEAGLAAQEAEEEELLREWEQEQAASGAGAGGSGGAASAAGSPGGSWGSAASPAGPACGGSAGSGAGPSSSSGGARLSPQERARLLARHRAGQRCAEEIGERLERREADGQPVRVGDIVGPYMEAMLDVEGRMAPQGCAIS